jgi:uncharacterized repeat protein (TIGR03803 family)
MEIMPEKIFFVQRIAVLVLLILGVLLGAGWTQTETVLHSFCSESGCSDGELPYAAGLVFDQKGNLYGTTPAGGIVNDQECFNEGSCGVVFKFTPEGKEIILYSFCAQTNCADGADPDAGLVFDKKGNLYGTTFYGGAYGDDGVVFKLTPEGKETVLHSFCAQTGCTDGEFPDGRLVFDPEGNLYGTTYYGGVPQGNCSGGCGVVFKITPEGAYSVLYTFCSQSDCADGDLPMAGVVLDQEGNLYGTTVDGGNSSYCVFGCGVVFKLTPKGKYSVLYSFCAQTNCTDGGQAPVGLTFDQKGNLYGTAAIGGAHGQGVVFRLTPEGEESVLYSFCAETNCIDGAYPPAGVIFDQKGNLYGTTALGGAPRNSGVVFKLTPEGKETVLYSFCWQENCTDGSEPFAGVVLDPKGNLYGTTSEGGAYNRGVVFKVTP